MAKTLYTDVLADKICERIANGESLREICKQPGMPDKATVFRWLGVNETFRDQYAHAREAQADALVDDLLSIADDGANDWMERKDADGAIIGWRENGEAIRRSQLRADTRKWVASKLKPKKYGDKIEIDHSGSITTVSDEQLDDRIAKLLGKAGASDAS